MIPLWMFPTGLVTGNTYVMKVCIRMPDLLSENPIDSRARETQLPAWHSSNYWWKLELLRELSTSSTGRWWIQITVKKFYQAVQHVKKFHNVPTARLRQLHLRPPGHPRHQLCRRWPCWKAYLQQGICKRKESSGLHSWSMKGHCEFETIFSATWGLRTMELSCQTQTRSMWSTRCHFYFPLIMHLVHVVHLILPSWLGLHSGQQGRDVWPWQQLSWFGLILCS